jgi:hypothetical protein
MVKGIAWILGGLLVVGGCWWLYNRANGKEVSTNGDVFMHSPPPDSKTPAVSADATPSPSPSDTANNPTKDAAPAQAAPTPAPSAATDLTRMPAPQSTSIAKPTGALPVADSIAPNPPNGTAFAGSGQYQWYRQGNLTWRVDTQSGTNCIAFATDEEWRKPRVRAHGCGNH